MTPHFRHSHLPALLNRDILIRLIIPIAPRILDLAHYIHTLRDLPKNNMLIVQKRLRASGNEKLATVRVGAGVRHRQEPLAVVLQSEILVGEGCRAVDTCRS